MSWRCGLAPVFKGFEATLDWPRVAIDIDGTHVGFVPVRKPGKLPREVIAESYELEYGKDTLEIHNG